MGLTRNSATLLGWKVVSMALGSATAVVLGRFLTPEDRGALALLVISISLVGLICQLGVPEALIFTANSTEYGRERMTKAALHVCGTGAIVATTVLLVLGAWRHQTALSIVGSSLSGLFTVFFSVIRHILLSQSRFSNYGLSVAIENVVVGILTIVCFYSIEASVGIAVAAQATSQLIALIYCLKICGIKLLSKMIWARPEIPACTTSIRHGLRLFATGICTYISLRLNLLLLQSHEGLNSVGTYTVANSVSAMLGAVPQQIGTAIYSATASKADHIREKVLKLFRYATAISVVTLVTIGAYSEEIVTGLFGAQYRGAGALMATLTAAGLVAGLTTLLFNALAGRGKTSSGLWGALAGLIIGGTSGLLLIPPAGLIGAGVAALLASLAGLVVVGSIFANSFEVAPLSFIAGKRT